jgi:hypothetical protein
MWNKILDRLIADYVIDLVVEGMLQHEDLYHCVCDDCLKKNEKKPTKTVKKAAKKGK